jgi:hypothetical protein
VLEHATRAFELEDIDARLSELEHAADESKASREDEVTA